MVRTRFRWRGCRGSSSGWRLSMPSRRSRHMPGLKTRPTDTRQTPGLKTRPTDARQTPGLKTRPTGARPADVPLDLARRVLQTEADAILGLIPRLDGGFTTALEMLRGCRGRVVVTGMGKSGIIARKVAATFSSTGTAAIFLHAAEAVHGDLGVVQTEDVVVALSYSGETNELIRLLEAIRRIGAKLISLTGQPDSTLGHASDVTLSCAVAEEACPMN